MSKQTWYVEFPTFKYNEDVIAIARKKDLKIVDAHFKGENKQCDAPPKLTLKKEYVVEETPPPTD